VRGSYCGINWNDSMKLKLNLNRKTDGRPEQCNETSRP